MTETTFMFQYAFDNGFHGGGISFSSTKMIEDTGLLTEEEALALWDKYYPDVVRNLEQDERPEMVIWKNCKDIQDYREILKEVQSNYVVEWGKIYKVKTEKTLIV